MSRRRRSLALLGAVLAIGAAVVFVAVYLPLRAQVALGAGTLAKGICSCVYLAERSPDDCRGDMFPVLDPIPFEIREAERRVWAGLALLGERTAVFREGFGCFLE